MSYINWCAHTHTHTDKQIHTCAVNILIWEFGKRRPWINHNSQIMYLYECIDQHVWQSTTHTPHTLLLHGLGISLVALIHFSCMFPLHISNIRHSFWYWFPFLLALCYTPGEALGRSRLCNVNSQPDLNFLSWNSGFRGFAITVGFELRLVALSN